MAKTPRKPAGKAPVWVWLVVAAAAIAVFVFYRKSQQAQADLLVPQGNNVPVTDANGPTSGQAVEQAVAATLSSDPLASTTTTSGSGTATTVTGSNVAPYTFVSTPGDSHVVLGGARRP